MFEIIDDGEPSIVRREFARMFQYHPVTPLFHVATARLGKVLRLTAPHMTTPEANSYRLKLETLIAINSPRQG